MLILLALLGVLLLSFGALIHWGSLSFAPVQNEPVFSDLTAPKLAPGATLKILSWNVQYMAGKNHVFWYEMPHNAGPDTRPTSAELAQTIVQVAQVIAEQNPDIIMLQEVDENNSRSDGVDQLKLLQTLISADYRHHTSTFYWKAKFVPHPRILGSAGMKLSVLSKYPVVSARRHALADIPRPFFLRAFNIRRAMLEVRFPLQGGGEFALINTHLEAFVYGNPIMQIQVAQLDSLLQSLNAQNIPFVAGGDLNLLPPGEYKHIQAQERWLYNPQSEMALLYKNHAVLPTLEQATGNSKQTYWTHFPNRPWATGLDRVIDYLIYSPNVTALSHSVIHHNTQKISDHLPVVAQFKLPEL